LLLLFASHSKESKDLNNNVGIFILTLNPPKPEILILSFLHGFLLVPIVLSWFGAHSIDIGKEDEKGEDGDIPGEDEDDASAFCL